MQGYVAVRDSKGQWRVRPGAYKRVEAAHAEASRLDASGRRAVSISADNRA